MSTATVAPAPATPSPSGNDAGERKVRALMLDILKKSGVPGLLVSLILTAAGAWTAMNSRITRVETREDDTRQWLEKETKSIRSELHEVHRDMRGIDWKLDRVLSKQDRKDDE